MKIDGTLGKSDLASEPALHLLPEAFIRFALLGFIHMYGGVGS
jgi:hypothetical protein